MVERGLCATCAYNLTCAFPREFPVLQCEEFICGEYCGPKKRKTKRKKQRKREKT